MVEIQTFPTTASPLMNAGQDGLRAQLSGDYLTHFGEAAPETMTPDEMAARLYPANPQGYLRSAREIAEYNHGHNLVPAKADIAQTAPNVNVASATEGTVPDHNVPASTETVSAPVNDVVATADNAPEPIDTASAPLADAAPENVQTVAATPAPEAEVAPAAVQAEAVEIPTFTGNVTPISHPRMDISLREHAMAWVHANHPMATRSMPTAGPATIPTTAPSATHLSTDKVVNVANLPKTNLSGVDPKNIVLSTGDGVEVRMPAAPDLAAEKHLFVGVIQDQALRVQLDRDYLTQFGEAAPQTMTPDQMVTAMYPANPAAYLKSATEMAQYNLETGTDDLAQNFQKIVKGQLGAACTADLPSSQAVFEKQGGILPNTCVMGKIDMAAGDYAFIRDAAVTKANAMRGGIRVLFSSFAERTQDFIARVVTAEALPDMSAEKLAAATPAP